jgi:hypothetical protein
MDGPRPQRASVGVSLGGVLVVVATAFLDDRTLDLAPVADGWPDPIAGIIRATITGQRARAAAMKRHVTKSDLGRGATATGTGRALGRAKARSALRFATDSATDIRAESRTQAFAHAA